jgi:cephalosporin-C deacetylase
MWPWAKRGFNVLGVDIRGFGRSREAIGRTSKWGYMLTGIDAPENYFLRGAVCDYIQATRAARDLVGSSISRMICHGVSFAGGLALMAEGVLREADFLTIGVPTFGWAEGRLFFVKAGSGKEVSEFLERRPDHAEDLMTVLRYFDPVNFAPVVTCPTLVGVGLADDVVPPDTVYAIANHIGGPHEIMEFPVSHTDSPEEQHWEEFERYWLNIAEMGTPDGFGGDGGRKIHRVGVEE